MTVKISIPANAQHEKHLRVQVVFFLLRTVIAQYGSQPNSGSIMAILSFRATMQKTELSWSHATFIYSRYYIQLPLTTDCLGFWVRKVSGKKPKPGRVPCGRKRDPPGTKQAREAECRHGQTTQNQGSLWHASYWTTDSCLCNGGDIDVTNGSRYPA